MKFSEVVAQSLAWLQREGRISYRALRLEFDLNDDALDALKEELIEVKELAVDKDGKMLMWRGNSSLESRVQSLESQSVQSPKSKVQNQENQTLDPRRQTLDVAAERRQLTVMFCDLVGSTALSAQLDPEDYRTVVEQYQQTCAEVIQRHEGYLAQYLGDGLLVYFGYPTAHEDDARRAVRTGLEIITALQKQVPSPYLESIGEIPPLPPFSKGGSGEPPLACHRPQVEKGAAPRAGGFGSVEGARELQVRLGIHTGLVVIGEIGSNEKRELLALGETPNIAARIQGLAEPNTVIISAATQRLIGGQFECQPFGSHLVKGIDTPIAVYHVQSERQGVSPLVGRTTLTPLVGREQEVGLLIDRWEQTKEGRGQVVLLSGEPGIGKSRLAYTLREHVTSEGALLFEARCSPYHQHSALYPLIDVLQRILLFTQQESDDEKARKLERALVLSNMQETLSLFTALFFLPTPSQYAPLTLTPQKQKERTLQALMQLLVAQAERQATVSVWEDLHWADPSSLEFLTLLLDQIPTTKLLLVLTFRPEFTLPWKLHSHNTQLTLNRLGKKQVEAMIEKAAAGSNLPAEAIEQIRIKTDGVPLFVEELTKSVVESVGATGRSPLQLAIPATLQEALLARLDRLSTARQIAQLGATLGREFSYELLHAMSPLSEVDLQAALSKLVEAEILYQRRVGQQAQYFFKHALIQDTAYQSLLKSTRQQYHQQIARMLEERFPDTKATQPELLAHHYTEAGLIEQAIPYWQQAGQEATQRSANVEAVSHLTKGLELLKTLPDTSERTQQELDLHMALSAPLIAAKGLTSPELERTYERAHELCQQLGETPELFRVLGGLWMFHLSGQSALQTARKLAEQLLHLSQYQDDSTLLQLAHQAMANTLFYVGELLATREHVEQAIALHDTARHDLIDHVGMDSRMVALSYSTLTLWLLGFPDQALKRSTAAVTLAQELDHPFNLATGLQLAALFCVLRGEGQATKEYAEAATTLSTELGFPLHLAWGPMHQGWALGEQGHHENGRELLGKGLSLYRASGLMAWVPFYLGLLAELHWKIGQVEEGLSVLAEAHEISNKRGDRWYEAELYRLRGELTLAQSRVQSLESGVQKGQKSENTDPRPLNPDPQGKAEACFLKAIEIAQRQQAKSWELRATTSLARLWQSQGKQLAARNTLSAIYNWFTEGFDTKDLQEAKMLIEELHH